MDGLSERLRLAVGFLVRNGYAKNMTAISSRLGVTKSTLCMVANGTRVPTWDLLLDFCDAYPIDFRWLRTGAGEMVRVDREAALLKRIADLEAEVSRLKEEKGKPSEVG